jgi:hypothetical protein
MQPISHGRHQFPPAAIQQGTRSQSRFTLGFRDVEELLAETQPALALR